jgi:hypothetical protein
MHALTKSCLAAAVGAVLLVPQANVRAQNNPEQLVRSPGIDIMVSGDLLRAGFSQAVDQTGPVSARVKRYEISGTGRLTGTVVPEPVPSAAGARLRLLLSGQSTGVGTTSARSVQLHTQSESQVCIEQEVFVDARGIVAGPAMVRAPTHAQLLYVESDRPALRGLLARGIARAVFRMRPQHNDVTATQVAENSLSEQAQRESQQRIADANKKFQEEAIDPLKDFDLSANDLHLSSTARNVFTRLDMPGTSAVPDPPGFHAGDLGVRVHQEVVNRFLEQSLGGTKHTGKPLENDLDELFQSLNIEPMPKRDPRPWSITLAQQEPITLQFDEDQVVVQIRGSAYTIELQDYPAMNIIVRYGIERTNEGFKALRAMPTVFPPETTPGAPKTLDRKQVALMLFLARKFADLFPREIDFWRIPVPNRLPANLQGNFTRVHTRAGWLVQEWSLAR